MRVVCEWDDPSRVLTLKRDPSGTQGIGRKLQVKVIGGNRVQEATLQSGVTRVEM